MSVIIIGAGMAGMTLALALSSLSKGKIPVALVEARGLNHRYHPDFDTRAIALAQGTCQQLIRVGIWPTLADCATAITQVTVSDYGNPGFTHLRARDYKLPELGNVINLHVAGEKLYRLLAQAPGVSLYCPAKVVNIVRHPHSACITLHSGQQLTGQLLVAADGTRSAIASACRIPYKEKDYQQVAIITNVTTAEHHQGRAFEHFTPAGPLALLPMSDGRSSLVWCRAHSSHQQTAAWDDSEFCRQLQSVFGWRLGKIISVGPRHYHPLSLRIAATHISHCLALVGNAAQTLHPIAGQGFNLGLRDVITLASILANAAETESDLGNYRLLSQYCTERQPDQQKTLYLTDTLLQFFANNYLPLVIGRNLGLLAFEHIPSLRHIFMRSVLGWPRDT